VPTDDLREARHYLPRAAAEAELRAFTRRQFSARERLARLLRFYGSHPCRMARIHLLTASSVVIGRSCGFSDSFNALGEAIMPVDDAGRPRSVAWDQYQKACVSGRSWTLRDELWLEAHAQDWKALRQAGLDLAFFADAARHAGEPAWQLLQRHAEMTVGTRQFDHLARGGLIPHETAISFSIGLALRHAAERGWPVIRHYLAETMRALLGRDSERSAELPSYRRTALVVFRSFLTAWGAWKVYRRGLRIKNRGVSCPEGDWPLLETLLGDSVQHVHPLIVKFYSNPGRFTGSAFLEVRTLPLMLYSRLAALLLGQGLYEDQTAAIPARLRVFRRRDGSMHFVRELDCAPSLRVFDSDFVLRSVAGTQMLVEVFADIGVEVVLAVEHRPGGGVAVVGKDIYWHGIRLPRTALRIEFTSRVVQDADGSERIEVVGRLTMDPQTALGRFIMHKVFRRPRDLGSITYLLQLDEQATPVRGTYAPPREQIELVVAHGGAHSDSGDAKFEQSKVVGGVADR
jgi:hypothetical protein